jgi:hypothetical protein
VRARRVLAAVWGLVPPLIGLAFLLAADRSARKASVVVDGRSDYGVFGSLASYRGGFRVLLPESEIRLDGLWARAPVRLSVRLASALPRAQIVTVWANGQPVHRQDLGGRYGDLRFRALSDAQGRLRLHLRPPPGHSAAFKLAGLELEQEGSARLPVGRVALYAAFLALAWLSLRGVGLAGPGLGLTMVAVASAVALALRAARLIVLAYLPDGVVFLAAGLAMGALLVRGAGWPRLAGATLAACAALKLALVIQPTFPSIDATLHAHKLGLHREGRVVTNVVGNPKDGTGLPIPYPPALYAALAPFAVTGHERAVRLAMGLLEGTAPLLVFVLMRLGGVSRSAAVAGAVTAAVMPEGMLVLAKGVAANIAGLWLDLAALAAILAGFSPPVVAGLTAVALLGHPGSAAGLLALLALWTAGNVTTHAWSRSQAWRLLGLTAVACGVAWLVYYREVWGLALATFTAFGDPTGAGPVLQVRWVHLAKLLQNLVLKYGAGPLWLAWAGWRRRDLPPLLRSLLAAWVACAALQAGLAVVTPFALRFEYFLTPAVAIAAGLGAERLRGTSRAGAVRLVWAAALALQLAVGVYNVLGRFEPISVIIPSPRWAWPFLAEAR